MDKITFKIILILGIGLFSSVPLAQTNLFEHSDFETIAKDHKIIAIVPFDTTVKLCPKEM